MCILINALIFWSFVLFSFYWTINFSLNFLCRNNITFCVFNMHVWPTYIISCLASMKDKWSHWILIKDWVQGNYAKGKMKMVNIVKNNIKIWHNFCMLVNHKSFSFKIMYYVYFNYLFVCLLLLLLLLIKVSNWKN